jgi:MYXO-CTERM domain-containing protein
VGAKSYSSDTGRVYVHLGAKAGLSTSVSTTLTGEAISNTFGTAIAGADLDGDGYNDLMVGAPGYSSSTGRVYLYNGSSTGLSSSSTLSLTGETAGSYFGSALNSAGDVDRNGTTDIVIGAYAYNTATGRAYLYEGSSSSSSSTDADGDGYDTSTDCDDTNASINPGAKEICDTLNVDEDCDGLVDDADSGVTGQSTWYRDQDGDTYGDNSKSTLACDQPAGSVSNGKDCNDADSGVNSGAVEVCDNNDNNCNGQVDEGLSSTWYEDLDGDGYGNTSTGRQACNGPGGYVQQGGDCNDSDSLYHPGASESCDDPNDYNCDGSVAYADADADQYAACLDCNDQNPDIHPDASEICDGLDNDCDSSIDNSATDATIWHPDADQDTFGDANTSVAACDQPSGAVTDFRDCDDTNASINPDAPEVCDTVDNNCDFTVDEGCDSGTLDSADTAGDTSEEPKNYQDLSGCGCATGGDAGYGWLLGLLVFARRRR